MLLRSERYRKLGDDALDKGHYKKALEYLDRAVVIDPKNTTAWVRKAAAHIYLRDYPLALEACDEAIKLDRKNADAWFNRALVLDRRRKFDDALTNYEHALRYKPRHIKALNNKGTVLGQLERWDDARSCFEQALKIDPDNEDAKENLKLLSDYRAGKHKRKCFIATAAFGSPMAFEIKTLQFWRDKKLKNSHFGRTFIRIYYRLSPTIADRISHSKTAKAIVRTAIDPIIFHLNCKYKKPQR